MVRDRFSTLGAADLASLQARLNFVNFLFNRACAMRSRDTSDVRSPLFPTSVRPATAVVSLFLRFGSAADVHATPEYRAAQAKFADFATRRDAFIKDESAAGKKIRDAWLSRTRDKNKAAHDDAEIGRAHV